MKIKFHASSSQNSSKDLWGPFSVTKFSALNALHWWIFFFFFFSNSSSHNYKSNICMFSFILFLLKLLTMTHIPCSSTHLSATCVLLHIQFVTYIEKGTKKIMIHVIISYFWSTSKLDDFDLLITYCVGDQNDLPILTWHSI